MERDTSSEQLKDNNNPIPHHTEQAPAASATTDPVDKIMQDEKEAINHEARAIPSGVPFPAMPGPIGLNPAPSSTIASTPAEHPNFPLTEKHRSSSSDNSSDVAKPPAKSKGFHFGKKRKAQDDEEKKAKEKEDEASKIKPVGIFQLFRYAKPNETTFNIIGLILAIASGAAQPLMTLIFGRLTTDFTAFGSITREMAAGGAITPAQAAMLQTAKEELKKSAGNNALYLMAIGIGMFLTTWAYMFIWNWTGEVNAKRIREKYLHATLRQDIAYFDDLGAGEVATRIQADCLLVQEGTSEKIPIIVSFLSTFFTGFILAFVRGWRLAIVLAFTMLPCIMIFGTTMTVLMKKHLAKTLEATSKAGGIAEEVVSSIRTVHAFGTSKLLQGKFDKHVEDMRVAGKQSVKGETAGLTGIFFVIYAAYGLAFYYGANLVYKGEIDVGVLINVFLAILIGSFSLAMLAPEVQAVTKATSAAAKLFATIERIPLIDSASPLGLKPDVVHGTISFENVKFHYPSRANIPILKGLTTTFGAGQTVALVGASGSGKSTVVALVERFYDAVEGSVKLDGVDIKDLNLKWLRRQIGLVSQEPTLFGTTVRINIEHGLIGSKWEHASSEEKLELVKKAAVQANAHDFIMKLQHGYDTHVGERGMLLSGGQKQRVAIARAIVSDPRILLLDEATSALDTQSEGIVQDALDKASKGRTTITIAHRLSTIRDADLILVMGGGEILEQGTHNSLLANESGPYAQLVSTQKLNTDAQVVGTAGPSDSDEALVKSPLGSPVDEKFPNLTRAATGRSLASAILERTKAEREAEENSKPKFQWKFYSRLISINKDKKWLYVMGTFGAVASGMVYPALSILFGQALGDFEIRDPDVLKAAVHRKALWYFITAIFAGAAIGLQINGFSRTGWDLTAKLRKMQFAAVIRHDIEWFDEERNSTGAVTSDLSEQPQRIQGLFGVTMGSIIQSCATLVGGCIIGLIYGPLLALVGIACIPVLVSSGYIRLQVVVLKDRKLKDVQADSAQLASEAAGAVRTVAALTREDDLDRIYSEALQGPLRDSIRGSVKSQALYAASQGISFLIIALVFYVGALWIISGRYTTAEFFTVLTAVIFASIQAGNVFNFVPDASKTNVAAAHIFNLFDYEPDVDALTTEGIHLDPAQINGHIRLEGIHFRYPSRPTVRVLRDLTLDIKPGQYVALVGPSGCGKSTTIQMLERFYDPLVGRVTIDGVDIRELNVSSYRANIALVSQEPTLYAGTVRFNILSGSNRPHSEITQAEIETACRDANILDFITSLPDGFETEVGGKGSQLSGGQKQRIAIARALIRNPKILLLDEATSALDSQSERVVQDALDKAAKGRTTIAIAHRLSTIQKADIIYCFAEGRVAEKGTHAELIAKKGAYYELVQMQNLSRQ